MTHEISEDDYQAALARGLQALAEPHAVSARYLSRGGVLEITYSNGLVLRIDPATVPALQHVPRGALAGAYVTPGGDGLVFGQAQADAVSLPGLVARLIPVDVARRTVAAARGKVRSLDKAQAARRNGAKGGRPPKRASVIAKA